MDFWGLLNGKSNVLEPLLNWSFDVRKCQSSLTTYAARQEPPICIGRQKLFTHMAAEMLDLDSFASTSGWSVWCPASSMDGGHPLQDVMFSPLLIASTEHWRWNCWNSVKIGHPNLYWTIHVLRITNMDSPGAGNLHPIPPKRPRRGRGHTPSHGTTFFRRVRAKFL